MTRKYELNRRAERQAETRARIVEAAVGLHTSVGPAQTTISAIAERAGVQRHTVYAHFRDERQLFAACSAHWAALHPFPDMARWADIDDPERRLEGALDAVYGWYERVGDDLEIFKRDSRVHSTTAALVERREQGLQSLRDGLATGWSRRKPVRAAIGHALELETWHSLVRRQGLTHKQAVDAMLRFVASV
ncbi:MAG: TetR/AcrR family transcriptional regulator [Actinobacteria bacterium]|nr:TetR/AcrR family transcriptional regulator [Actinomycetota bacterium]